MQHPKKIYGLVVAVAAMGTIQTLALAADPLKSAPNPATDPLSLAQSVGLTPQWDFGPVSVGGRYDSTLGGIAEARYSRLIDNNWAVGLIGEAGAKNNRINATLGHQFSESAQVKVTGEYLSQELPFYFDSGRIDERVGQASYGFQLRQSFEHSLFQNIQLGSYWSDAKDESLSTLDFVTSGGLNATNERHIAGSTSRGFNIGSDLNLGENTRLNATAIYDSIDYATKLSTYSLDRSGFGAALTLEQLLTERMKLSLKAENRPLIDSYGAQLQWLPESMPFSVALMSQRLVSNDQTPDSNVFGVNIGFALDNAAIQKPGSKTTTMSDIRTWVQQPAVRMERVQVRSEQRTTVAGSSVAALSVTSGSTAGGTTTTITGANFTGATAVTFGGVAATAFTVVNNTTITATAPVRSSTGAVDVVVTTPQGTSTLANAYTYNAAIIFGTAATPNGNLGGLSGADAICNADGNKPSSGFASGYTYKAMLNGNNATRSGAAYYLSNGTTLIAVANSGNLVGASSILTPIVSSPATIWTGADGDNCSNWTGTGGFGDNGFGVATSGLYWDGGAILCNGGARLYCVSQ